MTTVAFAKEAALARTITHCTAAGTADALELTTGRNISALSAGMWFSAEIGTANTGAMTVEVDGLTAVTVKTVTGADTPAGYIRTDLPTLMFYDGTNMIAFREVESGSNANGVWTKFADGTQTCQAEAVSTNSGSAATITLPSPMANATYSITTSVQIIGFARIVTIGNKTASNFEAASWDTSGSDTVAPDFDYVAAGTWY